jgi:hypothetical protein
MHDVGGHPGGRPLARGIGDHGAQPAIDDRSGVGSPRPRTAE